MSFYPECSHCGDDIVLASADQFEKRICPDCDARRVAKALARKAQGLPEEPTNHPPDDAIGDGAAPVVDRDVNPHGAEEDGAAARSGAVLSSEEPRLVPIEEIPATVRLLAEKGRVDVSLTYFRRRPGRGPQCVAIEEWLFATGGHLVATPREVLIAGFLELGLRTIHAAFVVVHNWQLGPKVDRRDIGGAFVPEPLPDSRPPFEVSESRAHAYNAATAWAIAEAKRLGIDGPSSYLPARTEI